MKNKIFLTILSVFLVFAFFSCDSGGSSDPDPNAPIITDFILLSQANYNANAWVGSTSFKKSDAVYLGIKATDTDRDWNKWVVTGKRGSTVIITQDIDNTGIGSSTGTTTRIGIGNFASYGAGAYTIEIYAVDKSGKKSNVKSVNFTVTD